MKNPLDFWLSHSAFDFAFGHLCSPWRPIEATGTAKSGSNRNVNEIPMTATFAHTAKEAIGPSESIGKQAS